jgi:NADP-dependent 3-hydroxy acid dehydrogenase YdfG
MNMLMKSETAKPIDGMGRRSVALVTGGASGIGRGIAIALLERGLSVTVGDVSDRHLAALSDGLGDYRERLHATRLDVASPVDWTRVLAETEASFGPVDVLCLNAGVGVLGEILASTEADWCWLMQVNLMGVGNGLTAVLPGMRARGGGHVMATSSMGGLVAAADGGIYSCAKFGVVAAIEVLRAELGDEGIVATVLCPAAVNTNIHEHEALRPSEFAESGIVPPPEEAEKMRQIARSILSLGADPLVVGRRTVEAMDRGDAYVFTDGSVAPLVELRRDALCASVA